MMPSLAGMSRTGKTITPDLSRWAQGIAPAGRSAYIGAMPLDLAAPSEKPVPARPTRAAPLLFAGAGLFFIAAGGLMWWRNGASVFTDMALAALAWCF